MIRSAANSIYYAHRQALLQAAEVDALRRGMSPELQRVGLSMWRAVLAAWKDRTPHVDIQGVLERKALGPLVDGALNAHAIGWKSAQQTPDDATPIRFSLLKETLATLKDAGDIDALQSQYKVDCLRMLTKASNFAEAALRDKMNDLISRGVHTRDGIKELATVFEAQGLSSNARMLETIFRTQHQLAYAAGRWRADQDSDVSDFIWGYRYTIVGGPDGDGRNRPSHIKLNGVTLPKDDPFWRTHWPPNGWNCRCQAVQVWKKATVVPAPKGVEPDKGFSFNSGEIFAPAVEVKKESAPAVRVPVRRKSTPAAKVESTPPQPSAAAKQATVENYSNKKVDSQVTAAALKDLGIDPTKKGNRGVFSIAQHQQMLDSGKGIAKLYRFKDGTTAPVEIINGIAWAHTPDGLTQLRTLLDRLGLPIDRYATPQEYIDWLSEKGLLGAIAAALQWVSRLVGKTFGLSVAGKVPKQ